MRESELLVAQEPEARGAQDRIEKILQMVPRPNGAQGSQKVDRRKESLAQKGEVFVLHRRSVEGSSTNVFHNIAGADCALGIGTT